MINYESDWSNGAEWTFTTFNLRIYVNACITLRWSVNSFRIKPDIKSVLYLNTVQGTNKALKVGKKR